MTMHYGPIEEAAVVCPCLGLQFSAPVIDLYRFVYLVVRFKSALEQLHHYPTLLLMSKYFLLVGTLLIRVSVLEDQALSNCCERALL